MVAVGWIAYELMRKPKEAATTVNEMNETTDHIQTTGSPASTSTQELIERRKRRAAEKRAQRMEAQEQVSAAVVGEAETEAAEPIAEDTAAVTGQEASADLESDVTDRKEQEKSEAAEDTQPLVPDSQTAEEVSVAEDSVESK